MQINVPCYTKKQDAYVCKNLFEKMNTDVKMNIKTKYFLYS